MDRALTALRREPAPDRQALVGLIGAKRDLEGVQQRLHQGVYPYVDALPFVSTKLHGIGACPYDLRWPLAKVATSFANSVSTCLTTAPSSQHASIPTIRKCSRSWNGGR